MTTNAIISSRSMEMKSFPNSIAPSQAIQPVIINLPEKTNTAYFIQTSHVVAAFMESTQEICLYDYTNGQLKQTFKCNGHVIKMQNNFSDLFVHLDEGGVVQAWNIDSGLPLILPETWQKVNKMFFLKHFTVLSHQGTVENSPLSLTLCDSNYQPTRKISTEYFAIHDMVSKINNLYITGIESNPINTEILPNGFLMRYEDLDKEIKSCKLNFEYDSKLINTNSLKINSGLIYNAKWNPTTNCVWDFNTLAPVLARKAEKNVNENTLTAVLGYNIVVVDRKEIAVYKVIAEEETELPFYRGCVKELMLEQSYGTKKLSKVVTIECQKGNPIKSIHLFKFLDDDVMAEGYENGSVIIRNLNTLQKWIEFIPSCDIKNVCTFKTNYSGDKLFVHFGTPSAEGILGVVYNMIKQEPFLYVTREALKNRNYDSTQDIIFYEYGDDLAIQSENQVLTYFGAMKSETKN